MAKKKAGKATAGRKKKVAKKKAGKAPARRRTGGTGATRTPARTRARKKTSAKPAQRRLPDWAQPFLQALKETRNASQAAEKIGKARSTVYRLRDDHEGFADAWREATTVWRDDLKACMLRRAIEGDADPKIVHEWVQDGKGRKAKWRRRTRVVARTRYDGTLQWRMAQKLMPEEFGKRSDDSGMDAMQRAEMIAGLVKAMLASVPGGGGGQD